MLSFIVITFMNPIRANAEWKKDNYGWWYTEGSSWATGWKFIDSKWYYFKYNGYLIQNAWMYDGYYLNSNGEWTDSAKFKREDILINGKVRCESGKICNDVGDLSNLKVINSEPCLYTWDNDLQVKYIGMNTLDVYDFNENKVDKVAL